jgi:hypothetical protein
LILFGSLTPRLGRRLYIQKRTFANPPAELEG